VAWCCSLGQVSAEAGKSADAGTADEAERRDPTGRQTETRCRTSPPQSPPARWSALPTRRGVGASTLSRFSKPDRRDHGRVARTHTEQLISSYKAPRNLEVVDASPSRGSARCSDMSCV
jgi:hypothetical protein